MSEPLGRLGMKAVSMTCSLPRPLAGIVLKCRLELICFCQLYLIAATLTRTIVALIARDERE